MPADSAIARNAPPHGAMRHYRFMVDEYYRMAEAGILDEDSPVELWDGEIFEISLATPPYASTVDRLAEAFTRRCTGKTTVRVRGVVRLSLYTEPQPDLLLLRRRDDFYSRAHPTPTDVLLLIEVSALTLAADRDFKMPRYARAGLVEAWIVSVQERAVTVFRKPVADSCQDVRVYRDGDSIGPAAFPEDTFAVSELFGEERRFSL